MGRRKQKIRYGRKWVLFGLLSFFVVQMLMVGLVIPRQASALFGVGDVTFTNVVTDIPRKISEAIVKVLKVAGDVAFRNMTKTFLNNLAYNYAVKIATGAPGQKPLFVTKPKELLKQAGDAAAGEFLDSLASSWSQGTCRGNPGRTCTKDEECPSSPIVCPTPVNESSCLQGSAGLQACFAMGCADVPNEMTAEQKIASSTLYKGFVPMQGAGQCVKSFSLCEPQDVTLKVNIQTWARQKALGAPATIQSKCPLSKIADNAENIYDQLNLEDVSKLKSLESFGDVLAGRRDRLFLLDISKSFNPEATGLGAYLTVTTKANQQAAAAVDATKFQKSLEGMINSVTSKITGETKTPAPYVETAQKSIFEQSISATLHQTGSAIADAVGTFTNTLAAKLLDRLINQGFNPFADNKTATKGGSASMSNLFGGTSPGITAAKILFANLQKVDFSVGGEVDVLSGLASCPDSKDPTPDTCVIDSRFRTAIEQKLTLQQALDQGLIDSTKPFGFTGAGVEPEYYNGYPFRSLLILRKYRIIPVGWELAAKYIRDYDQKTHTIADLMAEYDNEKSPYYRLINPNWVLKAPELYCKRAGAGEKITSSEVFRTEDTNGDNKVDIKDAGSTLIQRQDSYCADEQTCLIEGQDGSCKKFGYCVEEQPVWKFDGTGCDPQYNSCQTYATSKGAQVSLLKNSTTADGCNAGNAGCQWYCGVYDQASGTWQCKPDGSLNEAKPGLNPVYRKKMFNDNVEACDQSAEGCSQLIRFKGSGANLAVNGDFETFSEKPDPINYGSDGLKDTGVPDVFNSWMYPPLGAGGGSLCGLTTLAVSDAYQGSTAARLKSYPDCLFNFNWPDTSQEVDYYLSLLSRSDGRSFTFSFYAKKAADDPDCVAGVPGKLDARIGRWLPTGPEITVNAPLSIADNWTRYVVSGTFPNTPGFNFLMASFTRPPGGDDCDVIVDNAQIEEGDLTNFKRYEDDPKTYLKVPPDYLSCTGNSTTDKAECSNFALLCSESELGCEQYTSVTSGQVVNGVISNPKTCDPNDPASCDQCPAKFVGCRAYREMPIEHLPRRPARDPVSFVANSGKSCPASAVGCEEYTNIQSASAGGEGKEYYNYIRLCVNDTDAQIQPYYTWEGSEEFGYQLKKYDLKKSQLDDAPCTNVPAEKVGGYDPDGSGPLPPDPAIIWPNCVDGRPYDEDGDGNPDPHPVDTCVNILDTCVAGTCSVTGVSCISSRECLDKQLQKNPDCREFYDALGATHYRLMSRVIFSSNQCLTYRNSIDGPNVTYHMIPGQSTSCSAQYNGCRAYKGNAGNNSRELYNELFEGGSATPWIGSMTYSNESINVGGHSLLVNNSAALPDTEVQKLKFAKGNSYSVSFWAKGTVADTPVTVDLYNTNTSTVVATFPGQAVAQAGSWNSYVLGPLYLNVDVPATTQLRVFGPSAFYLDNFKITEVVENIYVIKGSYTECSGYENCDEYKDRANLTHYLKSFTRFCGANKVGCQSVIDTLDRSSPYAFKYPIDRYEVYRGDVDDGQGAGHSDNHITQADVTYLQAHLGPWFDRRDLNMDGLVDADDVAYLQAYLAGTGPAPDNNIYLTAPDHTVKFLVNDPQKACTAADKGCQRFGKPVTIQPDASVSQYSDVYLRNDLEKYGSISCLFRNTGCMAFSTDSGSIQFFKNPGTKMCEYKKVVGQSTGGWYKNTTASGAADCPVGTGVCAGVCHMICVGGTRFDLPCNGAADCPGGGYCSGDPTKMGQACGKAEDCQVCQGGSRAGASCIFNGDCPGGGSCGLAMCGIGQCVGGTNFGSYCTSDRHCEGGGTCELSVEYGKVCQPYLAGDVNHNGTIEQPDAQWILDYLRGRQVAPEPIEIADVNHDGYVDNNDVDYFNAYILSGGAAGPRRLQGTCGVGICDPRAGLVSRPVSAWVGSCPVSQSSCTEYRDPEDPVDYTNPERPQPCDSQLPDGGGNASNLSCNSYYYLSGTVDQTSCNGQVDRPSGCRIFNDTSSPELKFDSRQSKNSEAPSVCTIPFGKVYYPRGDVNKDGQVNVVDITYLVAYNSAGGPAPDPYEAGDVNNDGLVSMEDVLYLQAFMFGGGPPPYPRYVTTDCDTNNVIKTTPDRMCKRWLDCKTSLRYTDKDGNTSDLCTQLYLCEKMDPQTGACTKRVEFDDLEKTNQTYTSPGFADKIKNYSGMILAGLDWKKRCSNDLTKVCTSDLECAPGTCNAQVTEGDIAYQAMSEKGSVTPAGSLITDGDFGDSSYLKNLALSQLLSAVDKSGQPNGPNEVLFSDLKAATEPGKWSPRTTEGLFLTEEASNGQIPSPNKNVDENNVAHFVTGGQWTGVYYDLGKNVATGENYVISFRVRSPQVFRDVDLLAVQLEYIRAAGGPLYQTFADIKPGLTWDEYALGPIRAGYDEDGAAIQYTSVRLLFTYHTVGNDPLSAVDLFLDDVSMKPILETQETKCLGGTNDGLACRPSYEHRCLDNTTITCNVASDCPSGACGDCKPAGAAAEPGNCAIDTKAVRSCRLYPGIDSPYCSYVDENNTTHQGWYGYCIERDPDHPKYCLNWWPVDLITGESDIFGTLPQTMAYSGRSPLYMCAEAKGNYNVAIDLGGGWVYRDFGEPFILSSWAAGRHSSNCPSINFEAPGTATDKLASKQFLYRRPMVSRAYNFGCCDFGTANDHCTSEEDECCEMAGTIGMNHGAWKGFIMASDCEDDKGGCVITPSPTGNNGSSGTPVTFTADPLDQLFKYEIDHINFVMNRWSHSDWESNRIASQDGPLIFVLDRNSLCTTGMNCWSGRWSSTGSGTRGSNGGNQVEISVNFAPDANGQDKVSSYTVWAWDGYKGGGAWVEGIFYLKEWCQEVVKVVDTDGTSKAWADRLKSSSSYALKPFIITCPRCGEILYKYAQDFAPYGGMVAESDKDPVEWDGSLADDGKQPLFIYDPIPQQAAGGSEPIRGGSPYAIGNGILDFGTMCSGGGRKEGQHCKNSKDDCCDQKDADGNCIGEQGVCIGPQIPTGGKINWGCAGTCFDDVIKKLQSLFAAPIEGQAWAYSSGRHILTPFYTANWTTGYRKMSLCPFVAGKYQRPAVANTEYCGVPPVIKNLMVGLNGKFIKITAPTDITLPSSGKLDLSFSVEADPNQKPIRYIEIVWGEGNSNPLVLEGNFDNTTVLLSHTYSVQNLNFSSESIKIKVIDNWDWCAIAESKICPLVGGGGGRLQCRNEEAWGGNKCVPLDTEITVGF